jgi:polyisoprenoid-binding protein YceI
MTNKTKWSIDPAHSEIGFKIRHLMIANIKGSFKIFDASIYADGKDFKTAEIDLYIDTGSVTTGDETRDGHLKTEAFLDAGKHKQITFTSSSMEKPDKHGNQELWGKLTIRGISKNIRLNVQFGGIAMDPMGNEKAGFTVTGKINRNDWGLTWNKILESGGLLVSEEVNIACEIELLNTAEKEPEIAPHKDKQHKKVF